jgi:hypothetical protein
MNTLDGMDRRLLRVHGVHSVHLVHSCAGAPAGNGGATMYEQPLEVPQARVLSIGFMHRVYGWMALALALTGMVAYTIGRDAALAQRVFGNPPLFWGLIIAELALVLVISWGINRLTAAWAGALLLIYAALNGVTFSFIFLVYTGSSIASAFLVTAGTFGAMSLFGWMTRRDLSGLGSFLMMALIGLILASLVNLFWRNPLLYWITTYAGVLIFVGLTAYDTQKIKNLARQFDGAGAAAGEVAGKAAILGALMLYLDFINLFLFILRIMGRRR